MKIRRFPLLGRLLQLLIGLSILNLSDRASAQGFQLDLSFADEWGFPPFNTVQDLKDQFVVSGFLDAVDQAAMVVEDLANGKVPTIDDLAEIVEGGVEQRVNEAVAEAKTVTDLLALIDEQALRQTFNSFQSSITTPTEFAFSIPNGRVVLRRTLADFSLCAIIAGPGGTRVTLGISNADQLCGNPAPRFANPQRKAVIFADLAHQYSHIQVRKDVLNGAFSLEGTTYLKIHDDWVQLRFAGNDPNAVTIKGQFVIGFRLGFSAKLQAEVEGQILLEVQLRPYQAAVILTEVTNILKRHFLEDTPANLEASPAAAGAALSEIFTYFKTYEQGDEELGEISLGIATDAGIGVGVWDTGINIASVGAQFDLKMPLDSFLLLVGDPLVTYLGDAATLATEVYQFFELMTEGKLDFPALQAKGELLKESSEALIEGIAQTCSAYLDEIKIEYETGLYGLGDIGQAAAQTTPIVVMKVDIPIGKIFATGINGAKDFADALAESAKAVVWLAQTVMTLGADAAGSISLGQIIRPDGLIKPPSVVPDFVQRPRGPVPNPPTAEEWQAMAASLVDDIKVSARFGAIGVETASLGHYVRLLGGAFDVATSILSGAIRSAIESNEKPLIDALKAAPNQVAAGLKNLLIFNLQTMSLFYDNRLGLSGTVGAEGVLALGGSFGFATRFKTSTFLLAFANEFYDEKDGTLLAGIDIPIDFTLAAGFSVGEGAEFTLEGGNTVGMSLANLTLKDWGENLPAPAGLRVAGFEVLDFEGEVRQDESIIGSGWLALPMGGLVRATHFELDPDGRVVSGSWRGELELGPFGYLEILSGSITNGGLTGEFDLRLGLSSLRSNFRLRSDGLLFGNTSGELNLGGVSLTKIDLTLDERGSFAGVADTTLFGATSQTDLEITLYGHPTVNLLSRTNFGNLAAELELSLYEGGSYGYAEIEIFGETVQIRVDGDADGNLSGTTNGQWKTPWGFLYADWTLDGTGLHGSGSTYLFGAEFTADNLRLERNGRLTGNFSGSFNLAGQTFHVANLEIADDQLKGLTKIDIAGQTAVDIMLCVDAGGVTATFVNDLSLFGYGSSKAWLRFSHTNEIKIYGFLDLAFLGGLETLIRDQVQVGISDAQRVLAQGNAELAGFEEDLRKFDDELIRIYNEVKLEMEALKAGAEAEVSRLEGAFEEANRELDRAIDDLIKVSGDLADQLRAAEAEFRKVEQGFLAARALVVQADKDIATLDAWYRGLNDVDKFFTAVGYGVARGSLLAARGALQLSLDGLTTGYNAALKVLRDLEERLENAAELRAIKEAKDLALEEARQAWDNAKEELATIISIIADPRLHPRYVAMKIGRDAVALLVDGARKLIAVTSAALDDVSALVNFISANGPLALVKLNWVQFEADLNELQEGYVTLQIEAVIAGETVIFTTGFNLRGGDNSANILAATRLLPEHLAPELPLRVSPWTDDGSTGLTRYRTLWAYKLNSSGTTLINQTPVEGIPGINPAVDGRFSTEGLTAGFANDENALTGRNDGSAELARNFLYNGDPTTVTFEGLVPGTSYVATFLSVGFDRDSTRVNTFSGTGGSLAIDQNSFGDNQGIRIDYSFTASSETHTVTISPERIPDPQNQPQAISTFHLYALALSIEGQADFNQEDWKLREFQSQAFNPMIADDHADPDGDGIPNFLEYALRTDPRKANPSPFDLPVPVVLPGGVNARQFILPYRPNSADLLYRIQHSTNLKDWTDIYTLDPVTGTTTQANGVSGLADPDTGLITITMTDQSLFENGYWRISVKD